MMQRVHEPEVMDTTEEADGYDAMDHASANAAFVQRACELGLAGHTLDIGTGPGHMPPLILEQRPTSRVVGVDMARTMLVHAERHRAASSTADRIHYLLADAKRLPFADRAFDSVLSNTFLHHIPDPRPFLREAWRVADPAGAFLIRDLYRPPTPARARELVALHAAGANPYQQELFRASLCAAFTPEELAELADECGLRGAKVVLDSDRHMSLQRPARR